MIIIIITIIRMRIRINNHSRKKCSFVKEGLINILFLLIFNRTCLKPQKNYAVPGKKFFEIVWGCSIEVSSVCCEGNMQWNLKQRKYMASQKKDGKAFRGQ